MSSSVDPADNWATWLTTTRGHSWLVPVDEEFLGDSFNLFGLKELFPNYRELLDHIRGPPPAPMALASSTRSCRAPARCLG